MNNYQVSHALTWVSAGLVQLRNDLDVLTLQVKNGASSVAPANSILAPNPSLVSVPVPAVVACQPIDIQSLRTSIEQGLRASIRASLITDTQQSLREERQLTESSLMIRYDAMVCRIVKDHMATAISELRLIVDDSVGAAAAYSSDAALSAKAAANSSLDARTFADVVRATMACTVITSVPEALTSALPPTPTPLPRAGDLGSSKEVAPIKKVIPRKTPTPKSRGRQTQDIEKAMGLSNLPEDLFTGDIPQTSLSTE